MAKDNIKKLKVLAKKYKSSVDHSCLYETEVKLIRAEEYSGDVSYAVLIFETFDDMGNDKIEYPPEGEVFTNLNDAKAYFNEHTKGFYKDKDDEFVQTLLSLGKHSKPVEEQDLFENRESLKELLTSEE